MHLSRLIQREKSRHAAAKSPTDENQPKQTALPSNTVQSSIMRMQQTHGNAYVRRYLAAGSATVQRDGGDAATNAALDDVQETTADASGENALAQQNVSENAQPAIPVPEQQSEPSPTPAEGFLESIGST